MPYHLTRLPRLISLGQLHATVTWISSDLMDQSWLICRLIVFIFHTQMKYIVYGKEVTYIHKHLTMKNCDRTFLQSILRSNQRPLWGNDYFAWWSTCISISRKDEIFWLCSKNKFLSSAPYINLLKSRFNHCPDSAIQ